MVAVDVWLVPVKKFNRTFSIPETGSDTEHHPSKNSFTGYRWIGWLREDFIVRHGILPPAW
jgi:hypothetical protein